MCLDLVNLKTIKHRSIFKTFRNAKSFRNYSSSISIKKVLIPKNTNQSYLDIDFLYAISISKRDYKLSVSRNKIKRRIRAVLNEIVRKKCTENNIYAYLIRAHKNSLELGYQEMINSIKYILKKM